MISYRGKSKCGFNCGKRAKFKAVKPNSQSCHDMTYACNEHKSLMKDYDDPHIESEDYSEADCQTWLRL
jgi:hypothetical protein